MNTTLLNTMTIEFSRKGEKESEDTPVEVAHCRIVDVLGRDKPFQYHRSEAVTEGKHNRCHSQLEIDSLVEEVAYLFILLFAVAPCYQNLRSDTETECHHEHYYVEDTCNGGCS